MLKARRLSRVAAITLLLCAPALFAAGPAAADGLSRFEEALKQAPPGTLTYKSAKALGANGFVIEDVVLKAPDDATGTKTEPVAIKRVAVEDFDFASVDKDLPPNFMKLRAEGIAIGGKPAEGVDLKELTGLDKLTLDFQVDYRLDPERKTLTLNRLELDLAGLARLELSMVLDGVSADQFGKPDAAMNDATLRTATLAFDDRSLLGKVLPAAAKLQGSDADGLTKMGVTLLNGMRTGQGPQALAVLDALVSYIEDYKQPKGPLKITLNPPGKLSAAAISDAKDPEDAIKAMGLVVSYAGTRPGPAAAPAAPGAAKEASAGEKSGCAPGGRLFAKHEDAYWSVTVREPTQSGEKCVARIEGEADDIIFPTAEALAWSIDGPGKAVAKCAEGDKVVVLYKDGGWYAAKVTGSAGGKCAVKYEADGETDSIELKKVRRLD